MSDIYVGLKAQNIDIGAEMPEITGIRLVVDSDHEYVVGDAAGRMIEVECPWGTEDMAKSILATMSDLQYRPYTAERAMLDPAFELGDSVMVGGVSSAIINSDINYNGAALANIDAPALDEIDDEYPARQIKASSFERQLAYTRSLISKTVDSITLSVTDEDGEVSIQLKAGDKELGKPGTIDLTGVVTFSALAGEPTGTTTINGGWIETDTVLSDALHLYGDLCVYDEDDEEVGGYLGYTTSAVDGLAGMHLRSAVGNAEVVVTDSGAKLLFINEIDGEDLILNQIWTSSDSAGISVADVNYLQVYGGTETVKLRGKKWDFSEVDEVIGVTAGSTTAVFK